MRCCWMRFFSGLLVVFSLASSARATDAAAESFGKTAKAGQTPISAKERALAEFDTNGDGKLSEAERRAARTALQRKRRLAQTGQGEEGLGSTALAGGSSGYPAGGGTNPYGMGAGGYGTLTGTNPYGMGGGMSTYYYYGTGIFGQSQGGISGGGAGGACMGMGSSGGGHR